MPPPMHMEMTPSDRFLRAISRKAVSSRVKGRAGNKQVGLHLRDNLGQ